MIGTRFIFAVATKLRRNFSVSLVWLVGLCLLAGSTTGCDTADAGGQGPGHRSQTLALTPEQELALGTKAYREVLAKEHVVHSGPEVERVRHVGQRIAQAAAIEPLQREINLRMRGYRFEWEFNVLQSKQINAFCLPGGKVCVYTGLLQVAANDDQLATVMGHEIAHALAHHASERIAREQRMQEAIAAAAGSGALDHRLIGLLAAGAQVGSLAYDRRQESEADHIGVFLMTFAGYNPEQAVVFWERMQQATQHGGKPPEILSDHPSDAKRIAQLRQWVPRALAGKKAYDEGKIAPAAR
jgi:predicted Zn-dependent protease